MRWYKYAWQVIVGFVTLFLVFAAYSSVGYSQNKEAFEVVISGLLLIIMSIQGFFKSYKNDQLEQLIDSRLGLRDVRKLLNLDVDSAEDVIEAKKRAEEYRKADLVPAIFRWIICVVAILYVIANIG